MKRVIALLAIFLCLSSGLASQQVSSSQPQSSIVISSLEKLKEQLLSLQTQIDSYKQTIKELQKQIDDLKSLSETDKKLLTELTQQLNTCQADLTKAQTLYNKLSMELQSLSISYTISIQQGKIKTYIIIGVSIVAVIEGIVLILK